MHHDTKVKDLKKQAKEAKREAKMAKIDMKQELKSERKEMRKAKSQPRMTDLGLLALRLTAGGLMAGHGAQKLWGKFGGHGLEGTAGWLESLGLTPGKRWALLSGVSEFGGGTLTALGLGGPVGPIAMQGSTAMSIRKAHWGKPIWVSEGGAELPVLYSAIGTALIFAGPGRYSIDRTFRLKTPKALAALTLAGVVGGFMYAEQQSRTATPTSPTPQEAVMEGPEGGKDLLIDTQPRLHGTQIDVDTPLSGEGIL